MQGSTTPVSDAIAQCGTNIDVLGGHGGFGPELVWGFW